MPRVAGLIVAASVAVSLMVPVTSSVDAVTPSPPSARIAAGEDHTCLVSSVGGVKCWGNNSYGQLGNGLTSGPTSTPVDVKGLTSGIVAVAAGGRHTCAITSTGGVKCWGQGVNGELGTGTGAGSLVPVDVSGLTSGVTAIAARSNHTCALTSGGGVKCWGDDTFGVLGDGSTVVRRLSPVDVVGLSSGVAAIATGNAHTCALTSSGGVKCWGGAGYLGNGSGSGSFSPIDVVGLSSGVTAIAAGNGHTCAVTAVGGVKCWGANQLGQIGNGSLSSSYVTSPVDVVGLANGVTATAAGGFHTCALTSSGGVKCWGDNAAGELGNVTPTPGSTPHSTTPVDVLGLVSGATAIAAGGQFGHTCALMGTGGVKCWGYNASGQLGNGSTTSTATPVNVVGLAVRQTIAINPSKAPGTIARDTIVTFTATVKPLQPSGGTAKVRFEVYRKVSGGWRLASRKDIAVNATGKAGLRWTFSTAGSWYVRAAALANSNYAASAWSSKASYTVR